MDPDDLSTDEWPAIEDGGHVELPREPRRFSPWPFAIAAAVLLVGGSVAVARLMLEAR